MVPEAYHEFKQYGSSDIPTIMSYVETDGEDIWDSQRVPFSEDCIDKADRAIINSVVDKFADYTATDLVTLTHHQDPWKDAYEPHGNNVITNESIREYFDE